MRDLISKAPVMFPTIYLAAVAATTFIRLAVFAAVIFAMICWRGVSTIYALPSSLLFAQTIPFLMSSSLYYFAQVGEWVEFCCFVVLALILVGLAAWLLRSRRAASALLIALVEVGELVMSGVVVVKALHNPFTAPPLLTVTAVVAAWRLTILVSVLRIAAGRAPSTTPGIFD